MVRSAYTIHSVMEPLRLGLIAALASATASSAWADGVDAFEFFEEEARVMTAARRSEPVDEAPMSVEVITAEEVRQSGALNIWDLLRFRAGMDVVENRDPKLGARALVAVRGSPVNFINNLLVLVDGRSVYSMDGGGTLWEQLPVQLQDIERIEIVRGPNAALYGSNAGTGVINIITKRPAAQSGAAASGLFGTMGGDRHVNQETASVDHALGGFDYRLSYTHRADDGFPNANGDRTNDFLFSNKADFRGLWTVSPQTSLELFTGGSWDTAGQPLVTMPNSAQSRVRSHFEMAKFTHKLSEGSDVQAFVSRSEQWNTIDPAFGGVDAPFALSMVDDRNYQYDVDLQHHFAWLDRRMQTVWGMTWRDAVTYSDQRYAGAPRQVDRTIRGFVSDTARLTDRLSVTGSISLEDSDYGGLEPAYQVAMVETLAPDHRIRLSHALAPAQPTAFKLHANNQTSATTALVGNPASTAEKLTNYEVGYIGDFLDRHLRAEANVYYQRNRDLATLITLRTIGGVTYHAFATNDETISRGVESKLSYEWSRARSVYANYTFESVTSWQSPAAEQKGTPSHKFNFGGTTGLGGGFSASANVGWKDGYDGPSPTFLAVHPYWRLDARLSYKRGPVEVFAAGQNLTRPVHQVEFTGLDVPRTIYGGCSLSF